MGGNVMGQGMEHSTAMGYANVFPLRDLEWSDLQVPINAIRLSGIKPPDWADYKGSQVLAFGDEAVEGNEEIVFFTVQLPASYAEGTNVKFHVHWLGEDDTAGDVVWKFTYSWANVGDVFPGETTAAVAAPNSATDVLLEVDIADIDGTDKKVQGMLLCSLRRNSSNVADTFTGKSAYLMQADFHLQIDTPGSQEENTKN
jgi:hypothetical protein